MTDSSQAQDLPLRYLDFDIKREGGHSATLAIAMLEIPGVEVWAHQSCAISHRQLHRVFEKSRMSPGFRFPGNDGSAGFKLQWLATVWRANLSYYRDAVRAYRREGAPPQMWIASNADIRTVLALIVLSWRYPQLKIAAMFFYHPSRSLRLAGWLMKLLRVPRLRLMAEDPTLCDYMGKLVGRKVYPFAYVVPNRSHLDGESPGDVLPRRAVFLGAPREEKGFDLLVQALEKLEPLLTDGQLSVSVQASPEEAKTYGMEAAFGKLEALADRAPGVQLLGASLSEEAYARALYLSHFVLIPYRLASYSMRSSGIMQEAIEAGKPVVTFDGCLATNILRREGAGIVVEEESPEALARGIRLALDDFGALSEKAAACSQHWREQHSVAAYLREVRELWSNEPQLTEA